METGLEGRGREGGMEGKEGGRQGREGRGRESLCGKTVNKGVGRVLPLDMAWWDVTKSLHILLYSTSIPSTVSICFALCFAFTDPKIRDDRAEREKNYFFLLAIQDRERSRRNKGERKKDCIWRE